MAPFHSTSLVALRFIVKEGENKAVVSLACHFLQVLRPTARLRRLLHEGSHLPLLRQSLFAFGYGQSYTTFTFGEPKMKAKGQLRIITVPVTNTGMCDGTEVLHVYIRDLSDLKEVKP